MDMSKALMSELKTVMRTKTSAYTLHTEHVDKEGLPKYVNRLIRENSPYLLQHAHHPVNWYPWGSDAFDAARINNKPVFLSLGYSACHWCHVMAAESFDNEGVASLLNKHFISIKVDREQRPDLDEFYMAAVQVFVGQGGWPMSGFLTPEGKIFFGGSYFSPEQFISLVARVNKAWNDKEALLRQDADKTTRQAEDFLLKPGIKNSDIF